MPLSQDLYPVSMTITIVASLSVSAVDLSIQSVLRVCTPVDQGIRFGELWAPKPIETNYGKDET